MLKINKIKMKYEKNIVINDISFNIKENKITSIIGPNGSGKSTILKGIAKSKKLDEGTVFLHDIDIKNYSPKEFSKKISMLPQGPKAPEDFTVRDLVEYGRNPHLGWFGKIGKEDIEIIDWAIQATGIENLQDREVSKLSGGERQRAWLSLSLAQKSSIILLDEPTTFLDIAHQVSLLKTLKRINTELNLTVVMVLHDINHAARYSDEIIVVKDGEIWDRGTPTEVVNEKMLNDVYNIEVNIIKDDINNCPYFMVK